VPEQTLGRCFDPTRNLLKRRCAMNSPAALADHLDSRADTILAYWYATVAHEGDVPEIDRLSYQEFVDHVPQLLDRIADRLRGRRTATTPHAKTHGRLRFRQGYDIAEVVKELGHLRTALQRSTWEYTRDHDIGVDELQTALAAMHDVLDEATAEAIAQFQQESQAALKAALAEAERQRERAEEASRHKTRLMSALSHDARTPLNAVALSARLLEMNLGGTEVPEVAESLRTIHDSLGNVLDLFRDLLDLTRIEAGAPAIERTRFALEPALAECLSSIRRQAQLQGIDCTVDAEALATAVIETDRAKFKQILGNLLSNALRFTEDGSIRVVAERGDGAVRIHVEDTGIGIPLAEQERIFDEFSRAPGARGEGTGLGLAICRRLAELLGGSISLLSVPDAGSRFTLSLPAAILVELETATVAPPAAMQEAPAADGTILLADDDTAGRRILARLLRRMGHRVLEAADGRDVVELAVRERPRAVLMDVNMPVVSGIEATAALRADPSLNGLAIFALTGDVTIANRERMKQAGVDGFLEKPVNHEDLTRALASLGISRKVEH
jgi:signal transduction histidine kinase/ActR/RegA family two-component response regulator